MVSVVYQKDDEKNYRVIWNKFISYCFIKVENNLNNIAPMKIHNYTEFFFYAILAKSLSYSISQQTSFIKCGVTTTENIEMIIKLGK